MASMNSTSSLLMVSLYSGMFSLSSDPLDHTGRDYCLSGLSWICTGSGCYNQSVVEGFCYRPVLLVCQWRFIVTWGVYL